MPVYRREGQILEIGLRQVKEVLCERGLGGILRPKSTVQTSPAQ
jgi:hypothetical protein